jgi:hypothetical protein
LAELLSVQRDRTITSRPSFASAAGSGAILATAITDAIVRRAIFIVCSLVALVCAFNTQNARSTSVRRGQTQGNVRPTKGVRLANTHRATTVTARHCASACERLAGVNLCVSRAAGGRPRPTFLTPCVEAGRSARGRHRTGKRCVARWPSRRTARRLLIVLSGRLVVRHRNNGGVSVAASVAIRRPRHREYVQYSRRPASTASLALAHGYWHVILMSHH